MQAAGSTVQSRGSRDSLGSPFKFGALADWCTFILGRVDGTSEKLDTASPSLARVAVRAWEEDPTVETIAILAHGGQSLVIFARPMAKSLRREEAWERVDCRNEWCVFHREEGSEGICRVCVACNQGCATTGPPAVMRRVRRLREGERVLVPGVRPTHGDIRP